MKQVIRKKVGEEGVFEVLTTRLDTDINGKSVELIVSKIETTLEREQKFITDTQARIEKMKAL